MTDCVLCARRQPDTAYVCTRCSDRVAAALSRAADLTGALAGAIARQTSTGSGGRSGATPLPVRLDLAEQADAIVSTVTTWERHVRAERGLHRPYQGPTCAGGCRHRSCRQIRTVMPRPAPASREATIAVCMRLLATNTYLGWLRHRPEAAEALPELEDAAHAIPRAVDRRATMLPAGPCSETVIADEDGIRVDHGPDASPCGEILRMPPGAATVRCRRCGATYSAAARREWLLAAAVDHHWHAEMIGRALIGLEVAGVTTARIRGLIRHGLVAARGVDDAGRQVYRLGDVLDAIGRQDARRALRLLPYQGPICAGGCRHRSCRQIRTVMPDHAGVAA